MTTNPLLQLKDHGQSVWNDNIDRAQLTNGQFQRLLKEDGIVGVTANPTIFEKSISAGHAYDEQMEQLIRAGKQSNEIYETLVITDIQTVADFLRPIYEQTNGKDGYVSLEVSPDLAHDTEGTLSEVRRFWKMVDRQPVDQDSSHIRRHSCGATGTYRGYKCQHYPHLLYRVL